jgi:acyl-CoA thioester hydrolase
VSKAASITELAKIASMTPHSPFSHTLTIRWRDTDALGHVNHAIFLTYLEEGRDRFLEPIFGSPPIYVVARVEMDLLRELRLDRRQATVTVEVEGIGRTSVVLLESLLDTEGNVVARSHTTIVRWEEGRRAPLELSLDERAALAPGAAAS